MIIARVRASLVRDVRKNDVNFCVPDKNKHIPVLCVLWPSAIYFLCGYLSQIMLKFKKMGTEKIPMLLVTANVGSIFESPTEMLPMWTTEFLQAIAKMEPKFIGLHMQEVGGKTYEKSMQYVKEFIQRLCDSPELRLFDKIRIYLDEDFSSPEKFTALGNMYFIHSSLPEVKIWDFLAQAWVPAEGKETYAGNIEKAPTKEKAKFPQHFFPECKWSRKGFMRTRWLVRGTAFELVNVHLFHDASNILAMEGGGEAGSVFARSRRRALRHTLQHLHGAQAPPPFFMFGDFNFRLDTAGVVKKLTENLKTNRVYNGKSVEHTKVQFRSPVDDRIILTVGKKEFSHVEHQKVFREPWVLKYDKEMEVLKPHLYEFPVKFAPSYPFEENIEQPTHYMKTRCPSWCDRVLLSQAARLIIHQSEGPGRQRDISDSRKSISEQMDKHSRKSIAESMESGGSPSKGSQRSSGHNSSSESSPARSASPSKCQQSNASPVRKPNPEFDGLTVPGIAQSRKSIADPTNIMHALNTRGGESGGSPTRRRLVRNQSEGSPKLCEGMAHDLRKVSGAECGSQILRRRPEYGVIGESTCMGDHKPVFLRVLLQSDKGTVQCCMQDTPSNYCYTQPLDVSMDTCFHSLQNLIKCPSKECFEPIPLTAYRNRLASHLSCDSGFRRSASKDRPSSLVRLGTDPSLVNIKDLKLKEFNLKNSDYESFNSDTKDLNSNNGYEEFKKSLNDRFNCDTMSKDSLNDSIENINTIPNVQINIIDADFISYDGIIVNNVDPRLLFCANNPRDPYTPESIDSRSPYPEACSNEGTDSEKASFSDMPMNIVNDSVIKDSLDSSIDSRLKSDMDDTNLFIKSSQSIGRADYMTNKTKSVSPRQLKSRLENILKTSRTSSIACDNSAEVMEGLVSRSIEKQNVGLSCDVNNVKASKIKDKAKGRCKCFGCKVC